MPGLPKGEYNSCTNPGKHLYKHGNGYAREMKATEENLSDQAKLRRQMFAAHYIKTLNASSSAEFAKFQSPMSKGIRLLQEPYVQDLLSKLINQLDQDALMSQNEILFQLKKEALNVAAKNQGARISALAHMAKIQGMIVDKSEVKTDAPTGVMVVPGMTDPKSWSAAAAKSQQELKDDVKI